MPRDEAALVRAFETAWRAFGESRVHRYGLTVLAGAACSIGDGLAVAEPLTVPEWDDLADHSRRRDGLKAATAALEAYLRESGPIEAPEHYYKIGPSDTVVRRPLYREPVPLRRRA